MKKKHYILLGILCLFVFTNPSITAFKAYSGGYGYSKRPLNLFVCSVYTRYGTEKYIGFLGNFIRIDRPKDPNWNRPNPDKVFSKSIDTSMHNVNDPLGILVKRK